MDIYLMTYHEFDLYVTGYKDIYYMQSLSDMELAYNIGTFANPNYKKPKGLDYYLNKIHKVFKGNEYKDVPVDIEKSKHIERMIEKLKNKQQ